MKEYRIRKPPQWHRLAACDTCETPAGKQCLDLRFKHQSRPYYSDFAHRGRKAKG